MTQEQAGGLVLEFGITDRLRKAREHAGYANQKAFAELTGISRGTIANYENPEWKTRKSYILTQWALATGVDLHWLETGEGGPGGPDGEPAPDTKDPGNGDKLARLTAQKRSRAVTRRYLAA